LQAFATAAALAGVPVSCIGTVVAGTGAPKLVDTASREIALSRLSFSHF
jgi:thiamine-monophosphate kinase